MNKVRQMCAVAVVTAVLAVPGVAGIMDSPGAPAPAPAPTPSQTSSTSTSMTTVILTILSLIR